MYMGGHVATVVLVFIDNFSCRSGDELCIPVYVHHMCHIFGYVGYLKSDQRIWGCTGAQA